MIVIGAVPTSLTIDEVSDWLRTIGVNPSDVRLGTTMKIGPKSIDIEVLARDDQGKLYLGPDGERVATHRITIPIVDDRRIDDEVEVTNFEDAEHQFQNAATGERRSGSPISAKAGDARAPRYTTRNEAGHG